MLVDGQEVALRGTCLPVRKNQTSERIVLYAFCKHIPPRKPRGPSDSRAPSIALHDASRCWRERISATSPVQAAAHHRGTDDAARKGDLGGATYGQYHWCVQIHAENRSADKIWLDGMGGR